MSTRGGFARLLRAEWTKFRTVRGWTIGMAVAALAVLLPGLLSASGSHASCDRGPVEAACPAPPVGPGGVAVRDRFTFVHRALTGDGAITVRVTSMSGIITYPPPDHNKIVPGLVPWAKAGIIIKDGTRQGSTYAAMMVTARHGVRMQYDFTRDVAGRPGGVSAAAPRWLRLNRSRDTLTGYESADGRRWTRVGGTRLSGLPDTVKIGLFVASPGDLTVRRADLGGTIEQVRYTQATAVFDHVGLRGATSGARWDHADVGAQGSTDWERHHRPNGVEESGGALTVTGTGDIAPDTDGQPIEQTLTGAPIGLIVVIVVAALFITAEYRRGLIRTTLLAVPGRGRMLAAKAIVIAAVTFVLGLAAAAVTVVAGTPILRANGIQILPVPPFTQVRVVVGTAALLAVTAVLALALGAVFRRGVVAVVTALMVIIVPYLVATASLLPDGAARWLLRVTPAAGFAIWQSIPEYEHVVRNHSPGAGFHPLPPWAGFAVLCAHTALAFGLAVALLRRRDA